jgi:hypothetical protein
MKACGILSMSVWSILGMAASVTLAAEFTNGNMESFTQGVPDGEVGSQWVRTNLGLNSSSAEINSPFTNVWVNNGRSWKLVDDTMDGIRGFARGFAASPVVKVNFDFYLATLTNNCYGVQFDDTVNSSVHFRLDTNAGGLDHQFAINSGTGMINILTLDAQKWYNVQATLDTTGAGSIVGTITPYGGLSHTFSATMLSNHASSLSNILVRDRMVGQNGDLYLDNISILLHAQIPGDANEDNIVDVGDLGILAANYGQSGKTWSQGDFNGDGTVDVGDLGILAANYGTGTKAGADFNADYAKVFGATANDASAADDTDSTSTLCSGLGLPLIAGLALAGLMLVKLED